MDDEQIMLTFQNFRLHKESKFSAPSLSFKSYELNATLDVLNGYGDEACFEDWLEIYELPTSEQPYDSFGNQLRQARSAKHLNELTKNQKLFSLNFDNLIDELDSDKTLIHSQVNSYTVYLNIF